MWLYRWQLVYNCLHTTSEAKLPTLFNTKCTIVQSAVLRSHVIRPSVMLMDQDHIGWKSWKLIAWLISPTPSLFVAQRPKAIYLLPGEHGEIMGRLEVGWGKVACWSTKVAISLKCVKTEQKTLWRAYWNSPMLFQTVPSPTPYSLLFSKIGGSRPPPKTSIDIISGTGKATDFKFGQYIHRVHLNKSTLKILEKKKRGHIQGLPKFFGYPTLSQERVKLRTSNFVRIDRKKSPLKITGKVPVADD